MNGRIFALLLLSLLLAPLAIGQTLTVGYDTASAVNAGVVSGSVTVISMDNPASATGTVTTVKTYWSNSACTNAFKIKFFRRVGNTLTPTAERGPFSTTANVMTLTMSPAVSVQQGDLIGITKVGSCGNAGAANGVVSAGYLTYTSDVTASVAISAGTRAGGELALYGTGTATEAVAAILPVVGSVPGVGGSSFKTSLQMLNPLSVSTDGVIVFHHAGVPGSASDPGIPFVIGAGQLFTFPDITAALGTTGIGSIDIIIPTGKTVPQLLTRVYNDGGTNGTSGFYEEPVLPAATYPGGSRIVFQGATAFMVPPVDPTRTRFNIGVRTLFSGALINAQLLDLTGHVLASVTKTYPASYFEQVDSTSFFGGVAIGPNQIIRLSVSDGSAIVYGSTTDNVTQDPSVQYAIVAFAVL